MRKLALDIAVIGAGPVGLALALQASRALPKAKISLYDARSLEQDVSGDPRTLALSLGSVQLLQRLSAWPADAAQAITEVLVSQQGPAAGLLWAGFRGEPQVRIKAAEEGVPMLGAVLAYGRLVAALQAAWTTAQARDPERLASRFGTPVAALKPLADGMHSGVEVDAGTAERYDLAVVAEGGVFTGAQRTRVAASNQPAWTRDYHQTAWVGTAGLAKAHGGRAIERFTRYGPAALLPLPNGRAALVWCVSSTDDPVEALDAAQRLAVLNTVFPEEVGALTDVSPLKRFPLGLVAERSLRDGRIVRIGNAAQTLHPVAGQGLNLGLRDAWSLVDTLAAGRAESSLDDRLRHVAWQRAPDRLAMIVATDFLARSFTWALPGAASARALGLAALEAAGPLKSALARRMMFGLR